MPREWRVVHGASAWCYLKLSTRNHVLYSSMCTFRCVIIFSPLCLHAALSRITRVAFQIWVRYEGSLVGEYLDITRISAPGQVKYRHELESPEPVFALELRQTEETITVLPPIFCEISVQRCVGLACPVSQFRQQRMRAWRKMAEHLIDHTFRDTR